MTETSERDNPWHPPTACRRRGEGIVLNYEIDPSFLADYELHIKSDTLGTFRNELETHFCIDFYIARLNP